MNKAARIVINYCLDNDIGILVMNYSKTFQKDSYISKSKNQSFVDIPYEMLQDKLEYLCNSNGILLVMQEESYTSKAASGIRVKNIISMVREYIGDKC